MRLVDNPDGQRRGDGVANTGYEPDDRITSEPDMSPGDEDRGVEQPGQSVESLDASTPRQRPSRGEVPRALGAAGVVVRHRCLFRGPQMGTSTRSRKWIQQAFFRAT